MYKNQMRKLALVILSLLAYASNLMAEHVRGGEMYYTYDGPVNATKSRYTITLKLYIDCNATQTGQLDTDAPFSIFLKSNGDLLRTETAPWIGNDQIITYDPASNPCITNAPTDVCYRLRFFRVTVELDNTPDGYIIAFQRCCRIRNIVNVQNSDQYGATYICTIPGTSITNTTPPAFQNSSPVFNPNDAVAICYNSQFTYDFSADDPDDDSLVYSLCTAYSGGGQTNLGNGTCLTCPKPNPAANPAFGSSIDPFYGPFYPTLPYNGGYTATTPLGSQVSIDSKTGLISGVAPGTTGQYVVTACVAEYRDGVLINVHRKDIHIRVADCIPLQALLDPDYSFCDDLLVTFKNKQVNPPGSVYTWDFGDGSPTQNSTDIEGTIQHQYATAGDYTVKVTVVLAGQCRDETTTRARVWPGFTAGFNTIGTCILHPIQFEDATVARYGTVSKWYWDFGDETTTVDFATTKNTSWLYSTIGIKTATLYVESDKGCKDTLSKPVEVKDKPTIVLAFRDTLICSNRPAIQDTLQLHASGPGNFSWTPLIDISGAGGPDPFVWPDKTTIYRVQLDENGCINNDSVQVRVVDRVTLFAGNDTTICLTDTIQLVPATDGLKWTWTSNPASPINDPTLREPLVSPTADFTTFRIRSEIGKCWAEDALEVKTVPYPVANAGPDTTICFGDTAQLHGSMVAANALWAPARTLSNPTILDPLAFPKVPTQYVLRVTDVLGCPKPRFDTAFVNVIPEIHAFAGNDTSIVIGQPLQLQGSGAPLYEWLPATYLNFNNIPNPIANLPDHFSYVMRAYTQEGCFDLDTINIRVFKTRPDIFVPNAFKPGSSQNNVLRPILVGISKLEYFRVYNRWGQLVFETTQHGKGWDGTLSGKQQSTNTFVWMVQGKDFTGKTVVKKGTAVLIR